MFKVNYRPHGLFEDNIEQKNPALSGTGRNFRISKWKTPIAQENVEAGKA